MYELSKRNFQRLKLLEEKLDKIFLICGDDITAALDEDLLKRPAILMYIISCHELLNDLQDDGYNILEIFSPKEIRALRKSRNIIAHNYDGVDIDIIENTIRYCFPELLQKIKTKIQEYINTQEESSTSPSCH